MTHRACHFGKRLAGKTYWIRIHQTPTKYFPDLRTRLVDKYDQEVPVRTRSHEEDSFDRLYSCLEKIMILLTIFKLYWKGGKYRSKWGHERSNERILNRFPLAHSTRVTRICSFILQMIWKEFICSVPFIAFWACFLTSSSGIQLLSVNFSFHFMMTSSS